MSSRRFAPPIIRRALLAATFAAAGCVTISTATGGPFPAVRMPGSPPVYELRNGLWFDGYGFRPMTRWTVYGALTDRTPQPVDSVIDLAGGFVVPPFGEAHNHNAVPADTAISGTYLRAGIFYVKNPNSFVRDREGAVGHFNVPTAIDVVFSNGGLTGPGGHPIGLVKRNIARGSWTEADGEGAFYFSIGSRADLDAKWPAVLAGKPDFIKTYLLFSEESAQRLADTAKVGWRGLDPVLLGEIVQRAHRAGLRVATHVETAADFRHAVDAGVDEINHLPGFRPEGNDLKGYDRLDRYRITAADAQAAARRRIVVVTTVSEVLEILEAAMRESGPAAARARDVHDMVVGNLRQLRDAGVTIALGSDRFRSNSSAEVYALRRTRLFSDTTLLRMWSMTTPRAIFPGRRIGALDAGWEASFLVLDGNPLADLDAVKRIRLRMKQGVLLR